jgi:hypothetical protein
MKTLHAGLASSERLMRILRAKAASGGPLPFTGDDGEQMWRPILPST